MSDTLTTASVRHFLSLLRDGDPPSEVALSKALDELALAYHNTPACQPSDADIEAPRSEDQERAAWLRNRFPTLGHYAVSDPTEIVTDKPLVGDAIDDLADIAGDLEEVLWRFEHVSVDEAHWYFRMLFEIHWGRHLRELQLYLHAKMW
jgi:hypothetical protein